MGGFGYYRRIDDRVMCFATEQEADEYEREIKKNPWRTSLRHESLRKTTLLYQIGRKNKCLERTKRKLLMH